MTTIHSTLAMSSGHQCGTAFRPLPWRHVLRHALCLIHIQLACSCLVLVLTLLPASGASRESTDIPDQVDHNLTQVLANASQENFQRHIFANYTDNPKKDKPTPSGGKNKARVHNTFTAGNNVRRDSPRALVIAASIAAVSILVFFVLAYLWHTHQLDSRARKLAIQLAADAERGMRSCRSPSSSNSRYSRPGLKVKTASAPRASSESSQEQNHYEALTPETERAGGSEGGRSSVVVSESETGDNEDVFEPISLPPLGERGRVGGRRDRGAHRKWSRSRQPPGANMDKRESAVTDKDILTHFAKRRHSTFFI